MTIDLRFANTLSHQRRSRLLSVFLAAALLSPAAALAQVQPAFPVYGVWAILGMILGQLDLPLSCANPAAGAAQFNTLQESYEDGQYKAGLQGGAPGWDDSFPAGYTGLPSDDIPLRGAFADLVPDELKDPKWADPPPGSKWIATIRDNELPPAQDDKSTNVHYITLYTAGWYIPTAEDAAKLRVRMTYRAEDQLVGIYVNELNSPNRLTKPITRDTSSQGTRPGVVEFGGFREGVNEVAFVVSSMQQPPETRNYVGFAATFSAYCQQPPTPVPTSSLPALIGMASFLAALGGLAVRARRRRPKT